MFMHPGLLRSVVGLDSPQKRAPGNIVHPLEQGGLQNIRGNASVNIFLFFSNSGEFEEGSGGGQSQVRRVSRQAGVRRVIA